MAIVKFKTKEITMSKWVAQEGCCSEHNLVQAIAALVAAYDAASNSTYKIRKNLIEALKNA
jgi:hypothetical protein